MAERKHISLLYQYNKDWIGGTYYILNIIKSLKALPIADRPFLTIYHRGYTPLNELEAINYPDIKYIPFNLSLVSKVKLKIHALLGKKYNLKIKLPTSNIVNFYYRTPDLDNINLQNYYCWIPDLQDRYFPQFFMDSELKERDTYYKKLVKDQEKIVFSSNSALNDFNTFYPQNENVKKVLRFVSSHDLNFQSLSITDLKAKFKIKGDYFIVSNQFWKHKNHKLVLEAFNQILKKYPTIQLILTGKEYDNREDANTNHVDDLKNYVSENNLTESILFLGFIDRKEQLKLMQESIAIIQPSLFEGWSTVVEDAKFLGKCIICSDISVHKEQLPGYELFFEKSNKESLITLVEKVINKKGDYNIKYDHDEAIKSFGYNFLDLF